MIRGYSVAIQMEPEDYIDVLKHWIMEDRIANFWTLSDIYEDYVAWSEINGVRLLGVPELGRLLKADPDFTCIKTHGRVRFLLKEMAGD